MPDIGIAEPRARRGGPGTPLRVGALCFLAGAVAVLGWLWIVSTVPAVEVAGGFPKMLGPSTPFRVTWTNPHGVRSVTAYVEQNGKQTVAYDAAHAARPFSFFATDDVPGEASFSIGRREIPALAPGRATVVIEVQSNDFRAQVARLSRELPVAFDKPSVAPAAGRVFLRRGGTGVTLFTVDGQWTEAGVRVGSVTFPSFQVKNQPDKRICLFTVPPDAGTGAAPVLFARSESGVEVTAALPHRVRGRRFRERTIALGDRLLRRILDELDPGGAGGAAERFDRLAALRWENDRRLAALSRKSGAKRLWNGAFLLPPRSKVLSRFGDAGTYMSAGKPVLRERHMGLDMASVRNAPVPAANAGTVVFAGRLGVYGNCIAIDHGLGVLTVYSHLSRIDVRTGQAVEQGAEIGATGMTGLAAGDHLHLGVMVGGVFVDRVEWEDGHWMEASLAPVLNELD